MTLENAIDVLVRDEESGKALTRVCFEFLEAVRKNDSDAEDIINDIVIEIENEIGSRIGMSAPDLDDLVSEMMTSGKE